MEAPYTASAEVLGARDENDSDERIGVGIPDQDIAHEISIADSESVPDGGYSHHRRGRGARVYEIAVDLGVPSSTVMKAAERLDVECRSASSLLPWPMVYAVVNEVDRMARE